MNPRKDSKKTSSSLLPLIALVSALTFSIGAHSAPLCSEFLQSTPPVSAVEKGQTEINASEAGMKIHSLIRDYVFGFSSVNNTFSLFTPFYMGPLFFKKARLKISVEANERITISIRTSNPKHLKTALKKLSQIQEELFLRFNHSRETGEITPAAINIDPISGESSVSLSFEKGVSKKKIQMAVYVANRLLKLKPLAEQRYWELLSPEPQNDGELYHIPKHLRDHTPPQGFSEKINYMASSYAIPVNLPYDLYSYFRDSHSYKFILSSSFWTVESVYKTPTGELKTLALEVTPRGALIADFALYDATMYLGREHYLYEDIISRIESGDFKAVTYASRGDLPKLLHVEIDSLLDFFKELKDAGYELQPPKSDLLPPAAKPAGNLRRFRQ